MSNNSSITSLYINSMNLSSGTITNFTYNLPIGLVNVTDYYIKSVSIPFSSLVSIYPPNSPTGDVSFTIVSGFGTDTVHMGFGENTTSENLATILQNALNTATGSSNFTVIYNSTNYKYTISSLAGGFTLYWQRGAINQLNGQSVALSYGFSDLVPLGVVPLTSYTSTQAATSSGTSYNYYLKSCALTLDGSYSFFMDRRDTVLLNIPINTGPSGLIQYLDPIGQWIHSRGINLYSIDIELVDEYGNDVNLQGLNWDINIVFKNRPN
jgi:hypothetical protein